MSGLCSRTRICPSFGFAAIVERTTQQHGTFHPTAAQLTTFGAQLRKYGRDVRADLGARLRGNGAGRDLGYPPEAIPGERTQQHERTGP